MLPEVSIVITVPVPSESDISKFLLACTFVNVQFPVFAVKDIELLLPSDKPTAILSLTIVPAKVALAPVNVNAKVWLDGLNRIAPVPVFDMSAKPFVEKFKSSSKVMSPAKVELLPENVIGPLPTVLAPVNLVTVLAVPEPEISPLPFNAQASCPLPFVCRT